MVIKNPDGSVFRLRGPNPIMRQQEFWDEPLVHNFKYDDFITVSADNEVIYPSLDDVEPEEIQVPIHNTPVDPKVISRYKKKHPDRPVPTEPAPPAKPEPPKAKASDLPKRVFHCLSAVIDEQEDLLYGEIRQSMTYQDKFTFEGVVAEAGDLNFKLWTNSVKIGRMSIVFDPQGRRWWRVSGTEDKAGGVLLFCVPSDFNPSFD